MPQRGCRVKPFWDHAKFEDDKVNGRRRFDEFPQPAEATPEGIPLSFYSRYDLAETPESTRDDHGVENCIERFHAANPDYEDCYGLRAPEEWRQYWHRILFRHLAIAFSFDELLRLNHSTGITNGVYDRLHYDPALWVFEKIRGSLWRTGRTSTYPGWKTYVRYFNELRSFDFGLPGFETVLDMATGCNEHGYSRYSRKFLDGEFGFIVKHKGKPVLIIGFSLGEKGVFLAQVQPYQRTGNRWLYSLGRPLLDHVITRFRATFSKPLYLVDGASLAEKTRKDYANIAATLPQEVIARITSTTYARLPAGLRRGKEETVGRLTFSRLVKDRSSRPLTLV